MQVLFVLLCLLSLSVAKLTLLGADDPGRIAENYIVIYHSNTTIDLASAHWKSVESVVDIKYKYVIGDTFKGFAGRFSDATLEKLKEDPLISEIHCDGLAHAYDVQQCSTQNSPPWGTARTSHEGSIVGALPDVYYYSTNGANVDCYVLDTGIYHGHNDFGGRARVGANFVDSVVSDQNGHGTHCAGTIAGTRWGIAKACNLWSVKVLSATGSGSYAGIIQGMQWVTNSHNARSGTSYGSVASMSLGGPSDGGLTAALRASFAQGVFYSVAAGNAAGNACNSYPAAIPEAYTVGSTDIGGTDFDQWDIVSSFSNRGPCVDSFAPGSLIPSAGISGPDSSAILSGTSMACPHVSGVAALLFGEQPGRTNQQIVQLLDATAQRNVIYGNPFPANTRNYLLYKGC